MTNHPFTCFDIAAPIYPGRSIGGISIGTHIKALYPKLKMDVHPQEAHVFIWHPFYVRYKFANIFIITVHILDGKIVQLVAGENYQGQIPNGIRTGMTIGEAIQIEPRIYFDELREKFFIHYVPGIVFECHHPRMASSKIDSITIYSSEWDQEWD